MDKETAEYLSKYRLEKAKEALNTSKILYKDIKDYTAANNRAYYAIFYAIKSIFALEEIDFKRHKDVIAYFNQHYIKTEIFPRKLGKQISTAQKIREDNDYDDKFKVSIEKTEQQIETAEEVVRTIEKYINSKLKKD